MPSCQSSACFRMRNEHVAQVMHTVTIIRDHVMFGPYDNVQALEYFKEGKILLNDLARIDNRTEEVPFAKAVAQCGWKLPPPMKPWEVVRKIGFDFLLPFEAAWADRLLMWQRGGLIVLAGLIPLAALCLNVVFLIYLMLAVYVSILWSMFFWAQFKTPSSSIKKGLICFCVTAFLSTTLLMIIHLFGLSEVFNPLIENQSVLVRFIGFFGCAGLPEEICKAAVIFWIVRRPGQVLKPHDVVLYGLLSGFGFGIHEGLAYQLGINRAMNNADATYVNNVLRLTSLPFLHACWCGISSYFIAYAAIAPMNRYGLWLLAILIPASIHSAYDALCGSILGLVVAVTGVLLMMTYLAGSKSLRRRLL